MQRINCCCLILGFSFFNSIASASSSSIAQFTQNLIGEYNNFQQVWQENTKEDIHRVDNGLSHQHLHVVIRETSTPNWLYVKIYQGRDSSSVLRESGWYLEENNDQIQLRIYPWQEGLLSTPISSRDKQIFEKGEIRSMREIKMGQEIWEIQGDTLFLHHYESDQATGTPCRLLRCRYFSGWITYTLPDIPDSSFRMGNLRMHDQGDIQTLMLADGTHTDYHIELTQLVYGKRISIMKLAIYQEPREGIHINSRSITYTWTNPEAKRIGINLRWISSGWTLIEPEYISSNNMNKR